jgi:peptidyl-prolyl cis-trans isomerase SurA
MELPDNLYPAARSNPHQAAGQAPPARAYLHKERMTEKLTRINLQGGLQDRVTTSVLATFVLSAVVAGSSAFAQTQQQPGYQAPASNFAPASTLALPPLPSQAPITPNGSVVEDAVARINDQIITRTEYQAAEDQLLQEGRQDNLSQADLDDRVNNLLRDLIDEQLLLSKGKELGITGDAETIRELDDIRKKNNLPDMEALEKAAATQGVSFEDFKQHIRDQIIRQQVVRDQVGSHLNMTRADMLAYYNAHAQEFTVPEQVHLSEILIPTPENATQADLDAAQAKADGVAGKLRAGASFAAVARTDSGGPNAAAGGDLGDWKRGALGDVLEKATFPLPVGANTSPIRTRQGYVILHVDSHQQAGVPPLTSPAVEEKVQEALYFQQLQPALRTYLTKARADAYTEIAPGFTDTGSPTKKAVATQIAYTAYKSPPLKKKIREKQRVEQEKANHAQAELASARERVAEKQAARAVKADERSGKKVDAVYKPKKIRREKIRYGQAPEQALPNGTAETASGASIGAPITGQAPGVAMSPTESITTITTGTGADEDNADPFATKTAAHSKVRYADLEAAAEERTAKERLTKAEAKADMRPMPTTPTENADEKLRAQPLGLNGDTVAKKKKIHKKNEVKERMQEKPKQPKETPNTVAPTVNPDLATPVPAPASTTPQ